MKLLSFLSKKKPAGEGTTQPSSIEKPSITTTRPSGEEPPDAPRKDESFGIRSYLHQFYQSPHPEREDLEGSSWFLLPGNGRRPRRWGVYVCRVFTVIGLVLLLAGAIGIIVAFTWPRESVAESLLREEVVPDTEGMVNISHDTFVRLMRDPMRPWKMVGLIVFAVGGIILAASLLTTTLAGTIAHRNRLAAGFASEIDTPLEPPIRIYPGVPAAGPHSLPDSGEKEETKIESSKDTTTKDEQPASPKAKVPVMEEISKVQPDDEPTTKGKKQRTRSGGSDEFLLAEDEMKIDK